MLDFLKKANINQDTIDYMYKNIEFNEIYDVSINEEECLKIIDYLKKIGIKDIDSLLKYELQIFYKDELKIMNLFKKYEKNLTELVAQINEDYTIIEKL